MSILSRVPATYSKGMIQMKNEIEVTVTLPDGACATITVPQYKDDGSAVEQAAKYMLTLCGWREALVEDDIDDLEGMVKPRKKIND